MHVTTETFRRLIAEYVTAYLPQSWISKPPMPCVYHDDDEGEQTSLSKSEMFLGDEPPAEVSLTMGDIEDPDPNRDRSDELGYDDVGYWIDPTNFRVK